MVEAAQLPLFESPEQPQLVASFLNDLMRDKRRPSADELVREVRRMLGEEACWHLVAVAASFAHHSGVSGADRDYLRGLVESGALTAALRVPFEQDREILSTIDVLVERGRAYRTTKAFQEMVDFMGRFRAYAPYNVMLVRLQNPTCCFFATAKDWEQRFSRTLKEDARPMLILAPMHPVMLVYDLDQTEGQEVPEELLKFARFEGEWKPEWLKRMVENAKRYRIRVDFKKLSSTQSGFATLTRGLNDWKMRVAVDDGRDDASRFGIMCHELAHIHLGHLGSDWDRWWPGRASLDRDAMEVEAEAVAFIVTNRLGLEGSSAEYVSRHLEGDNIPVSVSVDMIAKTAGFIERMARELLSAPKPRPLPKDTEKSRQRR